MFYALGPIAHLNHGKSAGGLGEFFGWWWWFRVFKKKLNQNKNNCFVTILLL